jgi:hypothetical protein
MGSHQTACWGSGRTTMRPGALIAMIDDLTGAWPSYRLAAWQRAVLRPILRDVVPYAATHGGDASTARSNDRDLSAATAPTSSSFEPALITGSRLQGMLLRPLWWRRPP